MRRIAITILLITVNQAYCIGQNGFNGSFRFLEVPTHVILAGMGGMNVSMYNMDVNLFTSNPASTGNDLYDHLSLNYISYPGKINVSNISYLTEIGSSGAWGANLVYFNYGEMDGYDATGASTGQFRANEYAFTLNKSHKIGNYQIGGNLKYAYSGIERYSASAVIADLGGMFIHPEADFAVGLLIKNAGIVISDYSSDSETRIPMDLQVGSSFKPVHMPVRFSLTLYDLTDWKDNNATQESNMESSGGLDGFFRHAVFGIDLLIGKNVELLFGYDHKKRKELRLPDASGSSGFSYGCLIGVQAFKFGFSRHGYHIGGISNTFTLTTDLGRWIKRESVSE